MLRDANEIDSALCAVGELLVAEGAYFRIVIIGGAAMNLIGIVARATRDVDIVAMAKTESQELQRPIEPLPAPLRDAISTVARDFELPENWLNTGPAGQWDVGLPPGFAERVSWRRYPGLDVGLAARVDLICLKFEATADQPDTRNRHFTDLIALRPTPEELTNAKAWVRNTNAGDEYLLILDRVEAHVLHTLADDSR